ncbi:hypothetical protein [Alloscardovia omnicolens]
MAQHSGIDNGSSQLNLDADFDQVIEHYSQVLDDLQAQLNEQQ